MMRRHWTVTVIAAACLCVLRPLIGHAAGDASAGTESVVARAIRPIMEQYGIPGMAVGLVTPGQTIVYNRGMAAKATGQAITGDTLFEVGSISKTFTATLVAYAQISGKLRLSDKASQYVPALRGSNFDKVSVLNLGTHTPGGLPVQVPDDITDTAQLMTYFQHWTPAYAPGTYRTYSNPGIGLFGLIAAQSMNEDFAALEQTTLIAGLALHHTYLDVPEAQMANYAQGYTKADVPVRMTPGVAAAETYGIRTTAADLVRFVAANMRMVAVDERLQQAITDTHTGYYRVGAMTQDLVWEQYRYPVALPDLLAGNGDKMIGQPHRVTAIDPPLAPRGDVLINKTGSTNGFGAYVAFVPAKHLGIVLLANKNYPNAARVTAAYEILTRLGGATAKP